MSCFGSHVYLPALHKGIKSADEKAAALHQKVSRSIAKKVRVIGVMATISLVVLLCPALFLL
jgi:hypothetical protein